MAPIKRDLFLAATTREGFYSCCNQLVSDSSFYRTTIIKGSSGSGKSTTIGAVAAAMLKSGRSTDLIHCSADPMSLDGALSRDMGIALLDGTAPHTVDPSYPGARDRVFDLYRCLDEDALSDKLPELIDIAGRTRALRLRAGRFIGAAAEILDDRTSAAAAALDTERLKTYGEGLAARLMPKGGSFSGEGEFLAFASSVTPEGVTDYLPSIARNYKTRILLIDPCGAAGQRVLDMLLQRAREVSCRVTLLLDPLDPKRYEGILLEDVGAAVMQSTPLCDRVGCGRGVHLQRFYREDALPYGSNYLKFCRRSALSLICEAANLMDRARELHMRTEEIYKAAMDYELLKSRRFQLLKSLGLQQVATK